MRDSVVTYEAYRTWSIRQINTRTIRRSGENNGIDAVVESPFPHREIGVFYLVIPAGMLRCHEVHDHFTIEDDNTGQVYSWEYLGMLGNRGYKRRWDEKVPWYRDNGILPHDEGPGPNGTLIITRDDPKGDTDSFYINQLIEEVVGVCHAFSKTVAVSCPRCMLIVLAS
jgi:hypothetical protein